MDSPLTSGCIKQINIPGDSALVAQGFGDGFAGQLIRIPELMNAQIIEYYCLFPGGSFTVSREHLDPDCADTDFCLRKFLNNGFVYRPGTLLASARSHRGKQGEKANFIMVAVEMIPQWIQGFVQSLQPGKTKILNDLLLRFRTF
jgi:hypothetical protein